MSELRWHPLLGEWVATATHRQDRTFFPPEDYCPLCPTKPGQFPTEVPAPTYDMVVFENKFPSLQRTPAAAGASTDTRTRAGRAVARRVRGRALHARSSRDARASVGRDASSTSCACGATARARCGARDDVVHVFPFENKGAAIGVTLSHPHGQIYAYPFVPPVVLREIELARAHRDATGGCLFCDVRDRRARRRPPHRRAGGRLGRVRPVLRALPVRDAPGRDALRAHAARSRRRARCAGSPASSSACWSGFDALFELSFPVHHGGAPSAQERRRRTICTSSSIRRCAARRG